MWEPGLAKGRKTDGYRTIRIREPLYDEIERIAQQPDSFYRSVSEFVHEALRTRLEELRKSKS